MFGLLPRTSFLRTNEDGIDVKRTYSENNTLKSFSLKSRLSQGSHEACDITGTVPGNDQAVIGPRAVWDGHRSAGETKWSMSPPSILMDKLHLELE